MKNINRQKLLKKGLSFALTIALMFTITDLSSIESFAAGGETGTTTTTTTITTEDKPVEDEPSETEPAPEVPADGSAAEDQVPKEEPSQDTTPSGEEKTIERDTAKDEPAFDEAATVDGVNVRVKAEPGVFPEGASLSVRKVYSGEKEKVEGAVEEARESNVNVAVSYTFDIKVLDEDGKEIEPDTSKGNVRVSFAMSEADNQNLSADVYHIGDDMNAKKLESTTTTENDEPAVVAETDGFSYYTVEFTYGSLQYVMTGDSEVPLQAILDELGIVGTVSDAKGSNDSLFKPENRNGEWYIVAVKAFISEEWLRVTVDDVEIEIVVTDSLDVDDLQTMSEELGLDLYDLSTKKAGNELDSGIYYLKEDKDFISTTACGNGLKIKSGATVYLYIFEGVTLTAKGGNGADAANGGDGNVNVDSKKISYKLQKDDQEYQYNAISESSKGSGGQGGQNATGGGAGILVPSQTFLAVLGNGTLLATGGNGGKGGNGGSRAETKYLYYTFQVAARANNNNNHQNIDAVQSETNTIPQISVPKIGDKATDKPVNANYSYTHVSYVTAGGGAGGGGAGGGGAAIGSNGGAGGDGGAGGIGGGYGSNYKGGKYYDPNYYWDDQLRSVLIVNSNSGVNGSNSANSSASGKVYIANSTNQVLQAGEGGTQGTANTSAQKMNLDFKNYSSYNTLINYATLSIRTSAGGGAGGKGGNGAKIGSGGSGGKGGSGGASGAVTFSGDNVSTPSAGASGTAGASGSEIGDNLPSPTLGITPATLTGWQFGSAPVESGRTLSVTNLSQRSGFPSFQWYCDGTAIAGATGRSYVIPENTPVGEHSYYCAVTTSLQDSNAANTNTVNTSVVSLSVTGIPVTISGYGAEDKIYDGTTTATLTGTPVIMGVEDGDEVAVISAMGEFDNYNVGDNKTVTITVELGGANAGKYVILTNPTTTASVTKRPVTITAKDQSVELNADIERGTDKVQCSSNPLPATDSLTAITLTPTGQSALTTNGTITPSDATIKNGDDDVTANYNITYATGNLTVTKAKPVEIEESGKTTASPITYGQPLSESTLSGGSMKDKYTGTAVSGTFTWETGSTIPDATQNNSPASYKVLFTPDAEHAELYAPTTIEVPISVGRRVAELSWAQTALIYNGADQKPVATVTNLVGDDTTATVAVTVTGEKTDSNAKTNTVNYEATASALSGSRAANYTLESAENTTREFTIAQKPITITAKNQIAQRGDNHADGNENIKITSEGSVAFTDATAVSEAVRVATLAEDDALTSISLKGDTSAVADNLPLTVSGAIIKDGNTDVTDNYDITYVGAHLVKVIPTRPTYTAQPVASAITYGQSLSDSTITGTMVDKNDTGKQIYGTFAWKAPETKPGVSDSNSTVYTVVFTPDAPPDTPSDPLPENTNETEYSPTEFDITVPVNKATLSVRAENKTKTYGEADPELTYTVSGLQNGDSASTVLTGALERETGEAVKEGGYAIKKGTLGTNDNYTVNYTGAVLTINKADQTAPAVKEGYTISGGQITVKTDKNAAANNETGYEVYEFENDEDTTGAKKDSPVTIDATKIYKIRWAENVNYNASPWRDINTTAVVTVTIAPQDAGSVALTNEGKYPLTASVTLTATPNANYKFASWQDGEGNTLSYDAAYTFTLEKDTALKAIFVDQGKTVVQLPVAADSSGFIYDGSEKIAVTAGTGCILTNDKATDAGSYIATATLVDENHIWADGTTDAKTFPWRIARADQGEPVVNSTGSDPITITATAANTVPQDPPLVVYYTRDNTAPKSEWIQVPDGGITNAEGIYYFYTKGNNNYNDSEVIVRSAGTPVTAATLQPTEMMTERATLNGSVSDAGKVNKVWFECKAQKADSWTTVPGEGETAITVAASFGLILNGLTADTEYVYRTVAVLTSGRTIYGNEIRFRTPKETPPEGSITVDVNSTDTDKEVIVSVEEGNNVIASAGCTTPGTVNFTQLPDGFYNVVVRSKDGVFTETRMISIKNASGVAATFNIPKGKLETVVDIKTPDTPPVAVEGLNAIITDAEKNDAAGGSKNIEVVLDVEKKERNTIPGEELNALNILLGSNKKIDLFLDLSLYKTTTTIGAGGVITGSEKTNIGNANNVVLEIAIPYADAKTKADEIEMYRYHNGTASVLTQLGSRVSDPSKMIDGSFFVDSEDGYIFLYASGFSIYAIATPKAVTPPGGGGGGTPTPSYTPVITQPEHATITVNPASPKSGENATVTVTPEEGYETEDVIVKDKNGNTVPVTKNTDGTYTFTQPSTGPVTIEAIVKQATDLTPVIKKPEHGTISANPGKPKAGEPAIITVTPDEGYEVDSVIITDKEGKPVAFTLNEDGTYSFIQPASGCVTIEAVLRLKNGVIVRFDLNGKTGTEPDPQTFIKGGKAVRPNDPAAEGYKFTGWFTDKECTKLYDFDTAVEEDITLYAGWEKKEGPDPDDDFGIYFAELCDDPYEGVHYNADYNDGEGRYEIVYTGAPIKPLIKVTSKADGVLKEGIDYSVSYSNNKNYSKKKPATIKVSGKGFYKSKKVLELYILQADLEEAQTRGLIAGADELKTLSGKKLNPVIVYRGYKLKSRDRDINNKDKITSDTTTDITGKGNFTGTLKDVEVKVIGKDDQKKGAIKVNLKAGKHVYNGEAHELSIATADTAGELTVTAGSSKTPLEEGTDFVVSYSGNTDAGKAAVTITGIGEYNGTVVKNFTIEADKATEITAELSEPAEPVCFNVRGAKPDITVTAHRKAEDETVTDEVLTEGKDYKVSYSSNMKIGDGAYTVKFLGNYKGHKDAKGSFKIVQAPIEEAKVEAVQMIYKKPGKYLPKPFVSIDGVQLKNSDYTYKYYIDKEEITSKYKLSLADDETSKTVRIVVTGKGNYTDTTAEGTYEVVRRTANAIDLTKAKIVAKDRVKGKDVSVAKQEYNGYAIEPEIRVMAKVNKKWVDVDPDDYTVSYINNVNKGTGTILITGDGEKAIGSKTARFSINTMRFELFKLIFGK